MIESSSKGSGLWFESRVKLGEQDRSEVRGCSIFSMRAAVCFSFKE